MVWLQRIQAEHAEPIRAFEEANRSYFSRFIGDRGDDYFDRFAARYAVLLAEQETGECHFHVLIDDAGTVLGRFNLYDVADGSAEVGYRVAEHAAGRGVATDGVRALCRLAAQDYGLTTLTARVTSLNKASRRVVEKAGFSVLGPTDIVGLPGTAYELRLDRAAAGVNSLDSC